MASTRYVFFVHSLLSSYCMVDMGWDGQGSGGWAPLDQDDEVSSLGQLLNRRFSLL